MPNKEFPNIFNRLGPPYLLDGYPHDRIPHAWPLQWWGGNVPHLVLTLACFTDSVHWEFGWVAKNQKDWYPEVWSTKWIKWNWYYAHASETTFLYWTICSSTWFLLRTQDGYNCASYDWEHDRRCMDFLSPGGYVYLSSSVATSFIENQISLKAGSLYKSHVHRSMLRLTLAIAVNMMVNGVAMMGPDCSSWGLPARGSSWRSTINIHGFILSRWVQRSSMMITRLLDVTATFHLFGIFGDIYKFDFYISCPTSEAGATHIGSPCKPLHMDSGTATAKLVGITHTIQLAYPQCMSCALLASR
jgi:hypothetical protein